MKTEPSNPECVCNYCGRTRPQSQPEFPPEPNIEFLIDLAKQGLLSNDEFDALRFVLGSAVVNYGDITEPVSKIWTTTIPKIQTDGWVYVEEDEGWYCPTCQAEKREVIRLDDDRDELVVPVFGVRYSHEGKHTGNSDNDCVYCSEYPPQAPRN